MPVRILDEDKQVIVEVIGRELMKNGYVRKMWLSELKGKEYQMWLTCTNEECAKEIFELFKEKKADVEFYHHEKDDYPKVVVDVSKKPEKSIRECFR